MYRRCGNAGSWNLEINRIMDKKHTSKSSPSAGSSPFSWTSWLHCLSVENGIFCILYILSVSKDLHLTLFAAAAVLVNFPFPTFFSFPSALFPSTLLFLSLVSSFGSGPPAILNAPWRFGNFCNYAISIHSLPTMFSKKKTCKAFQRWGSFRLGWLFHCSQRRKAWKPTSAFLPLKKTYNISKIGKLGRTTLNSLSKISFYERRSAD